MVKDLNLQIKSTKPSQESAGLNHCDFGFVNRF